MSLKNLSKTFRYVNEMGSSLTFEYANGYLINQPKGIDTLVVNLMQAQGIGQVGSVVESKMIQSRPVIISGIIVGDDQDARKQELMAVVRPDVSGKLYADDYFLNVHPTATPTVGYRKQFANFQFSVTAPYPYWQKEKRTFLSIYGVQKLFKFPWNLSRPYKFGELSKKQFVNVHNLGQVPTPFIVRLEAFSDVEKPRLENIKTGQFLSIDKNMAPGERIVIEITHDKIYVTSSVDGNIRGALDLESDLFRLNPGDNVIKPTADSGLENLDVSIDFAPEIAGVTV